MHHRLKSVSPHFEASWEGSKPFEVRLDDRHFRTGDTFELRHYCPKTDTLGNRIIFGVVGYILNDDFPGLAPGYVCFSALSLVRSELINGTWQGV